MSLDQLRWLPEMPPDWRTRLRGLAAEDAPWPAAMRLANARLDFTRTNALDHAVRQVLPDGPLPTGTTAVRLAILGTSTLSHLHAAIRVAGLRRNIPIATYETAFGQHLQELLDSASPLHAFRPTTLLIAFDAHDLTRGLHAAMSAQDADAALADALARIEHAWTLVQRGFACPILHQTVLDVFPPALGSNEHRLPGSRSAFCARLNHALRPLADTHGVNLVAVDDAARRDGLAAWHDPALWHRSKQEITPARAPTYGELVARLIAARQGRSAKCLVLDLDNTLWGGVIGDDGLDGIVLGQGSALGEGFAAVQAFAKNLAARGIILAVNSKNDEAIALEPFEKHSEMILRRADIASFRANWQDKAANIRAVAQDLNIGLDSLVFLDDNPFERNLVRQILPMVAVPELPDDDPASWPALLSDAGYFESLGLTPEDLARTAQYQKNAERTALRGAASDLDSYLRALDMMMIWSEFDSVGRNRIVQLINKTNQFNLTTRRHTGADVDAIMADPRAFGLQIRLLDRFGDNGIIAVVIGKPAEPGIIELDTWLMSCRVLGRGVERATLNLAAAQAIARGATHLRGRFIPTAKNAMVRDHYTTLGFTDEVTAPDGSTTTTLDLTAFFPLPSFIETREGTPI